MAVWTCSTLAIRLQMSNTQTSELTLQSCEIIICYPFCQNSFLAARHFRITRTLLAASRAGRASSKSFCASAAMAWVSFAFPLATSSSADTTFRTFKLKKGTCFTLPYLILNVLPPKYCNCKVLSRTKCPIINWSSWQTQKITKEQNVKQKSTRFICQQVFKTNILRREKKMATETFTHNS